MTVDASIVINVRNGERYLGEALDSALGQTYSNLEVIIWDNASKDATADICENYSRKDSRVRVFRSEEATSLYAARNLALKVCSGKYIAFLDSDDLWSRNKLEVAMHELKSTAGTVFFSNFKYVDKVGETIRKAFCAPFPLEHLESVLARTYFVALSSLVVSASVIRSAGGFRSQFDILGDFDLVLRLAASEVFCASELPLVSYRIHEANLSRQAGEKRFLEIEEWNQIAVSEGRMARTSISDAKISLELDGVLQSLRGVRKFFALLAFAARIERWSVLISKVRWKITNLSCSFRIMGRKG